MAKVTALRTFIGSAEELEQYGNELSPSAKKLEKKMTAAERASHNGRISEGTVMEVTDKRAKELSDLGLVEWDGAKKAVKEDKAATTTKEDKGAKVMTTKNVKAK